MEVLMELGNEVTVIVQEDELVKVENVYTVIGETSNAYRFEVRLTTTYVTFKHNLSLL